MSTISIVLCLSVCQIQQSHSTNDVAIILLLFMIYCIYKIIRIITFVINKNKYIMFSIMN